MTEGLIEYGYWGLLLASFLAATILPLGSEVVFSALIVAGLDVWTCILFATIGNALGGLTCYLIGSLGKIEWVEKYLKIKREKIEKMQIWLHGFFRIRSGSRRFNYCSPWIHAIKYLDHHPINDIR